MDNNIPILKQLELDLTIPLIDSADNRDTITNVIVRNERNIGLSFGVEGCGLAEMDPGYSQVAYLEIHEGKPRLLIWADINDGDPTHTIDLSGALEINRLPEKPEPNESDASVILNWLNCKRIPIDELIAWHNAPLKAEMLAKGCRWVTRGDYTHFVDDNGLYAPFPSGYITGPQHSTNGNPRPWSYSINSDEGWRQWAFPTLNEAQHWVRKEIIKLHTPVQTDTKATDVA